MKSKLNVTARIEFELAYDDVAVQENNYLAKGTPHVPYLFSVILKFFLPDFTSGLRDSKSP